MEASLIVTRENNTADVIDNDNAVTNIVQLFPMRVNYFFKVIVKSIYSRFEKGMPPLQIWDYFPGNILLPNSKIAAIRNETRMIVPVIQTE